MSKRTLFLFGLVLAAVTLGCRAAARLAAEPSSTPRLLLTSTPEQPAPSPTAMLTPGPVLTPLATAEDLPLPTLQLYPSVTPVVEMAHPLLVVFRKSGCFAGVDERLFIYRDGRYDLQDRSKVLKSGRLDPAALEHLSLKLFSPDFAALQPLYQAAGADLCVYTITLPAMDSPERSVTTMDAAPTPPFLAELIGELRQVTER